MSFAAHALVQPSPVDALCAPNVHGLAMGGRALARKWVNAGWGSFIV